MAYKTVNPYTGRTVKTFEDATDEQVREAIDSAHSAFMGWKETPYAERSKILNKAAAMLRRDKSMHARLITLEMGKLLREAEAEIELSAKILEYYAKYAEELLRPKKLDVQHDGCEEAYIIHEPLGVLLTIQPWNFPYYQVARVLAPQICAGNALILKHTSNTPQCAAAFEELMLDAGLPEKLFQNLYLTRRQIEDVILDPRVQGVSLTGSAVAGAAVAAEAGRAMKKSTLELGGSDAFIVLDDADVDKAAKWAVFGRHWNAGQVCVSSKRIIVVESVYDEFLKKYKEGVEALVMGDPMEETTTLAPLSSQQAVDGLRAQVEEARREGITVTPIGPKPPAQGAFFQPVLLTDIHDSANVRNKEFFGPVSMIFKAKDETDAIRIANDNPFGLGGSVFTRNIERGKEVAKKIVTGMVYINHPTKVEPDLPFGGVKGSGYGHELIDLGLKEFVNHKLIGVIDIDSAF